MKLKRRHILGLGLAIGGSVLAAKYLRVGFKSIVPEASSLSTKEITPNNEFYVTHYSSVPEVDLENWRLQVDGEVERALSLAIEDISELPQTDDYNTLLCIGNGIGGDLIGNAKWKGVRMRDVLELAGLKDTAQELVLHGADGYSDSFPLERGLRDETRLVYSMNEEPLPAAHGLPLRCVVPGLYGIKNVKWLTRIEVLSEGYTGYWQKRGWDRDGFIKVVSRIDQPRDAEIIRGGAYEISGVAFAGEHQIEAVEISADGGKTWDDAVLKPPLSRFSWTLWRYDWRIPGSGDYEIAVRARDGSGRIQTEGTVISRRSFPDGADGFHKIKIKAVGF